ncbi:hypothetical protein B4119_2987 [Parageobacillus caldoxylosilyticus]|uniref:Uncharacterized protein n=1 Tax=Saccharococcus caldoxylosilyticus TaxID=81408 RepID=A0A150LSH7_9BACL|nr:hypothetical protein B4119_2987 [Parageobacillus caldoxylosilyticus]
MPVYKIKKAMREISLLCITKTETSEFASHSEIALQDE